MHDRNETHDRNIANDRNETNQTNDANVFTCRTKRQCLKLDFEPKLWFENIDVMRKISFISDGVDSL